MSEALKLIAQSEEDVQIVSSLLQDMTIRVADMAWLKTGHRFVCVGNRFRWEKKGWFRRPKGQRIRTAFHLNNITSAKLHEINLNDGDTVLELLDIEAHKQETGFTFRLNFAGGATVHLESEVIDGLVSDLGDSWDAIERPRHDLKDA